MFREDREDRESRENKYRGSIAEVIEYLHDKRTAKVHNVALEDASLFTCIRTISVAE